MQAPRSGFKRPLDEARATPAGQRPCNEGELPLPPPPPPLPLLPLLPPPAPQISFFLSWSPT